MNKCPGRDAKGHSQRESNSNMNMAGWRTEIWPPACVEFCTDEERDCDCLRAGVHVGVRIRSLSAHKKMRNYTRKYLSLLAWVPVCAGRDTEHYWGVSAQYSGL